LDGAFLPGIAAVGARIAALATVAFARAAWPGDLKDIHMIHNEDVTHAKFPRNP